MIKFIHEGTIIRSEKKVKDVYSYRPMDNGVYFYYHTQHDDNGWELFANTPAHERHFIQIGKDTFRPEDIIKNPERIFALMQQDSIDEALDKLPG